ncbi:MAG: efflux RND transporter periplasmic adaptor subunit [Myxococcota bacterium]|nr:efflux RND transporter periplasmic adaptor subunit [Myxococcota bacterium]
MRPSSFLLAMALCLTGPALAHEGEDHAAAPGTESAAGVATGPVEVSGVAQRNLGLTVAEVELRPIETTLRVIGEIQADPARSGTVSSRISGRVSAVFAQEGEHIEKGKRMVEVESLQLGDPPPRVGYVSPVSGVVTDRHVVVGDDVEPNRHLFELADLREVLAIGRVFEGQIGQVAAGQKVRVRVPSYPDDVFEGVVERLGGKLEAGSRSLAVYIRVANPEERLRPYMRATLSLVTGGEDLALAIPKTAVLGEGGELYAFVQDEERAERFTRRPLVLGVSDDRFVEVIEGLSPSERVVTEGNYSLQYVTPIREEADEDAAVVSAGEGEPRAHAEDTWIAAFFWAAGLLASLMVAALVYRIWRGRLRAAPEAR